MDQNSLVESIRTATREVFQTMLGWEVESGEPYADSDATPSGEAVIALIGLAGEWVGNGSVNCSAVYARKIASHMLMMESPAVDSDVLDVVAEVANMIIGNVKTALEEVVGPMGMSIPTIIFGKNFTARSVGNDAWTAVPFSVGEDRFEVKICVAPNPQRGVIRRSGFTPTYTMND